MPPHPVSFERIYQEKHFHELQARKRASHPGYLESLVQNDQVYLGHASWIRPGMEALGNIQGKAILDWGCGHGMASVCLARKGANVYSLELSHGYSLETFARAKANNSIEKVHPVEGDASRLPFKNECFDGIWGNAILHHLDCKQAAIELDRVLKPKGVLILCDPWQNSRLVRWIRDYLPYPGKDRTKDEKPLNEPDLESFRTVFPKIEISFWDLFGALGRFIPLGPLTQPVRKLDHFLINSFPGFAKTARYVMIKAIKE